MLIIKGISFWSLGHDITKTSGHFWWVAFLQIRWITMCSCFVHIISLKEWNCWMLGCVSFGGCNSFSPRQAVQQLLDATCRIWTLRLDPAKIVRVLGESYSRQEVGERLDFASVIFLVSGPVSVFLFVPCQVHPSSDRWVWFPASSSGWSKGAKWLFARRKLKHFEISLRCLCLVFHRFQSLGPFFKVENGADPFLASGPGFPGLDKKTRRPWIFFDAWPGLLRLSFWIKTWPTVLGT